MIITLYVWEVNKFVLQLHSKKVARKRRSRVLKSKWMTNVATSDVTTGMAGLSCFLCLSFSHSFMGYFHRGSDQTKQMKRKYLPTCCWACNFLCIMCFALNNPRSYRIGDYSCNKWYLTQQETMGIFFYHCGNLATSNLKGLRLPRVS